MRKDAGRRGLASPLLLLWLLLALKASGSQAAAGQAAGGKAQQSAGTQTWLRCGASEYGLSSGSCAKCSTALPGCVECKDALTCTLCRAGYRLNVRRKCVSCQDRSCLLCLTAADRCTVCKDGFFANPAGRCIRCHEGCAGACNADGTCSTACLEGYGKVGGICRKCRQPTCENCDGHVGVCKRCFPLGYGLVAGQCLPCNVYDCARCRDGNLDECTTCNFGYYNSLYSTCDVCEKGCDQTSGCNPDGTCRKCLPGYGNIYGYCQECDVNNTEEVPYNACDNCDGDVKRCNKCSMHYGLTLGRRCANCSVPANDAVTCEQCDGDINRCSACNSMQYRTSKGLCAMCTDTLQHCSTCTDASTCTSCWVGHTLVRGRCVACPRGCEDCTGNRHTCRRCSPFHVMNPRTRQCIPY